MVILPDGRLRLVPTRDATTTVRKFEPVSMDEMARTLVAKTFAGFKTRTTKRYLYVYNAYLTEVSRRGPLEKVTKEQDVELFKKYFPGDPGAFDAQLVQHLQKLPYEDPIVNQTHYVVLMKGGRLRGYLITTSPTAVVEWQKEQLAQRPTTQFLVQAFPNAATATIFAKSMIGK
ncbi:MAG TPA: hypothetical protein PK867_27750 [Pirellulales bacterium]|nr:hypothetical protein [Pirellulales bacterium]